jgi:hypothetical protein
MVKMSRRNVNNCREGVDLNVFDFTKWIIVSYMAEISFVFKGMFYLENKAKYTSIYFTRLFILYTLQRPLYYSPFLKTRLVIV